MNIKKPILKISALLVIAGLNWTGLCAVGQTLAAFNDVEDAQENGFQAGVLDFSLNSPEGFSPEELDAGDNSVRTVDVNNGAGSNFEYQISSTELNGDLCDYVSLEANLDAGTVECAETGLSSFACSSFEFADAEQWVFNATLSSATPDDLRGSVCNFRLNFEGWQVGSSYGTGGFTDTEEIDNEITMAEAPVAGVVLNEFLPYPDGVFGDDNDNKPLGEWVELYNNSGSAVDLDGWYVTDASGGAGNTVVINAANAAAHLSPAITTISANGFLVVYMNKAVFNNNGDMVKLFNASNELIDSVSYTGSVPANKSFARIPDGTGGWVDPIPTPGRPNIQDEVIIAAAAPVAEEVVEEIVSGGAGELTEETVPADEPASQEEPAVQEPVVPEETPESEPEDVVEEIQPELEPEPEIIIEEINDDSIQEESASEPIIEQGPVTEPEPVAEPVDDNSGSDGSSSDGEPETSGETAE